MWKPPSQQKLTLVHAVNETNKTNLKKMVNNMKTETSGGYWIKEVLHHLTKEPDAIPTKCTWINVPKVCGKNKNRTFRTLHYAFESRFWFLPDDFLQTSSLIYLNLHFLNCKIKRTIYNLQVCFDNTKRYAWKYVCFL